MKHWTIGKRVVLSFVTIIAFLAGISMISFVLLKQVRNLQQALVTDVLPGMEFGTDMKAATESLQVTITQHTLAVTLEDKKPIEDDIDAQLLSSRHLMDDAEKRLSMGDKVRIEKIRTAYDTYTKAIPPLLALSRAGKTAERKEMVRTILRPAAAELIKSSQELFDANKDQGNATGNSSQQTLQLAVILVTGVSAFAAALGIAIAIMLSRDLNKKLGSVATVLNDASAQVSAAASQVSGSSQSLAHGASEQAASLEETSASLEEINGMSKRNTENAHDAKALAQDTRQTADQGTAEMQEMIAAMDAIKSSSDNIAKIIKTIDEIAFQTNILALNAAVEAARAGEAGMGFAVVADEVRTLAQRSAQAAKETADKIDDSINKSSVGVEISGRVAEILKQIAEKTRKVDNLIAEIATASAEQNQGIGQVNQAISQMDKVTQANAGNAEETAAAAEELTAQSIVLRENVAELLQLIDGSSRKIGSGTSASPTNLRSASTPSPAAPAVLRRPLLSAPGRNTSPATPAAVSIRGHGMPPVPGSNGHDKPDLNFHNQ